MTNKQCRKKVKKLKRNIRQYIVDKKLENLFEKCEEVKVVQLSELKNNFCYCFDYKSDVSIEVRKFITSYISQFISFDKDEKYYFCFSKSNTQFILFETLEDMCDFMIEHEDIKSVVDLINHLNHCTDMRKEMFCNKDHIFQSEMN